MSYRDIYSIYMLFTSNHDVYILGNNTWCSMYTCIPWLYCRNGMHDPENVGLVEWRGKEGIDVETGEPWQPRVVSQNKSYGLAEWLCKFVEIDSNTFTSTCSTTKYFIGDVIGVKRNEYWGHWWGCAWYRIWFDTWLMRVAGPSDLQQQGPRSYKAQLWVRRRIRLLLGWHGRNGLKDGTLKEWLSSRPLALRPIYWEISSDAYTHFKMGYEAGLGKEIFNAECAITWNK